MRKPGIARVAILAVFVATGSFTAQGNGQGATPVPKAPTRYPVKPAEPGPEPPAPAPAPAARPAPAPPASTPGQAPATRYPVKPSAASPAGAPAAPAPVPAVVEAMPSEGNFKAQGLINEPSLLAIFRGDFSRSTIPRDSPLMGAVMQGYLTSFAQGCSAYLPPNKVEMLSQECATERVTTNGFGAEVSRVCVEWVNVRTGLFADPELYAAKTQLERQQAGDAVRTVLQMMTTGNPMGSAMGLVAQVQGARDDMTRLVGTNACGGPELKRFGENLRRFALNQPGLKLEGQPGAYPAAPSVRAAAFASNHDFVRLVDDLIADQSRTWLVNRYQRGGVGAANVVARDAQGQPTRIEATYSFIGFDGPASGSVIVTFVDGAPSCLYFFDSPACRTPGSAIVSAYLEGRYAR